MNVLDEMRRTDRTVIEEAFRRQSVKDVDGFLELFTEDLDARVPWQVPGLTGSNAGRDELRKSLAVLDLFDPFAIEIISIDPLLDSDRWLVTAKSEAVVVPTGRPYRQEYVHLLRLRDGKIAQWVTYQNPLNQIYAFDIELPLTD